MNVEKKKQLLAREKFHNEEWLKIQKNAGECERFEKTAGWKLPLPQREEKGSDFWEDGEAEWEGSRDFVAKEMGTEQQKKEPYHGFHDLRE